VALDCVTVKLVGELEPIETLPLTTVPPLGSVCAIDGCAQPRPDNSAIRLTEVRNSRAHDLTADEGLDVNETINRTAIRYRVGAP
jgi:hypothetical protein